MSTPQDHSQYVPTTEILQKYADLLINFALGDDEGIKPGEVVELVIPDVAKQLALQLQNSVLKAGGHPLLRLLPTGFDRYFFELADPKQLQFFPDHYVKSRIKLIDHQVGIIADVNPFELKDTAPEKILLSRDSKQKAREWLVAKETQGKFTWTIALWGVQAKAEIVGLSLEQYWQQIINACFLDASDPVVEWRRVKELQQNTRRKLNQLKIDRLSIKGSNVDLIVKLGPERAWKGGADRNIPSFELFTSPDWRGTEGWIEFNQPVYRYGNQIDGVGLEFHQGLVTKATAKKGKQLLDQMLRSKNANKIGEFSLTDSRLSRITHLMAETLYDENIGGPYGNMHLAIGSAYRDCFDGDMSKVAKADWKKMGYNESPEHTDIVTTANRTVTAILMDGNELTIYKNGKFVL